MITNHKPTQDLDRLVGKINAQHQVLQALQTKVYQDNPDTNPVYQLLGRDVLSTVWSTADHELRRLVKQLDAHLAVYGQEISDAHDEVIVMLTGETGDDGFEELAVVKGNDEGFTCSIDEIGAWLFTEDGDLKPEPDLTAAYVEMNW